MTRIDFQRLEAASKRLGEAVLDPAAWPLLMEEICRAVGTTGASLLQSDIRTTDVPMTSSASEIMTSYFKNGLHINDIRAVRGGPLLLAGRTVVSDQDLFRSEQEMLRYPLYANLNNFGFRWWAAVGFMAGSALWGLCLQRQTNEGAFEGQELLALGQLSPRLTETATLSKAVGRAVLSSITTALHHIQKPAVSFDRSGLVIDVNNAATAVFDDDIHIRNNRLYVRDEQGKSEIASLFAQMRSNPDTSALPAPPIIVRRRKKAPVVLRVLPVDGPARGPFLGARIVLVLYDVSLPSAADPALLGRLFNLTKAEAKLAVMIASGYSPEMAADEIGIRPATARNQLKAVFAKTGTHRQNELAALLNRL